ncbi:MAG: HAMP domain-containing sensor histidine kinase [candidate division WOR-3 bacterium]
MSRFTVYSIVLAVLVIVIFNIHSWLVISKTKAALEAEMGNRLEGLALTIATQLTGREDYQDILPIFTETISQAELLNIFLVDESLRFIVNARAPESKGETSPMLELDESEILSAFSGLITPTRLYAAGPYYLKTVYAPVYNREGIVSAVLGVEADARFFKTIANYSRSLFFINLLSLLALSAIVFAGVSLSRRALRMEKISAQTATFALLGEMAAALAHDLRNPLATILAATERIQIRYDAQNDQTFDCIKEELSRLNRTLANYLNIGTGKAEEMEEVDITEMFDTILDTLKTEIRQNDIQVENHLRELPKIKGSPIQLRQVFINILLNAIQAQPNGGLIRISAQTEPGSKPRWLTIQITDHGPGIPHRHLNRVFEPFFTTKDKGSGLGLFIVKRLVEMHQGKVKIISDEQKGTTVEVKLPV